MTPMAAVKLPHAHTIGLARRPIRKERRSVLLLGAGLAAGLGGAAAGLGAGETPAGAAGGVSAALSGAGPGPSPVTCGLGSDMALRSSPKRSEDGRVVPGVWSAC